jgi:hypothetical protein
MAGSKGFLRLFIFVNPLILSLNLLSLRDRAIVAWHEVPGTSGCTDHTVPYGTVLSWDAFPGTSCQATIGAVPSETK